MRRGVAILAVLLLGMNIFSYYYKKKDISTLSDLVYNKQNKSNNEVYLLENDVYVPYLVITDDYKGNALLLRRNVLDEPLRINEYYSYYEDSEIDLFLNSTFLEQFSEIANLIKSVDITIITESSIGVSGDEKTTINRKIFLLSIGELNIDSVEQEGVSIDFFNEVENRISYTENGSCVSWWLRTPDTWKVSCTYTIGSNNRIGSSNSSDLNYVRPALCLDSKLHVTISNDIVKGKSCYILDLKK